MKWSVLVTRTLLFSLIWWLLTEGEASSWLIGVPAVLCALAMSIALQPRVGIAWMEVLKFLPYFLLHSVIGGFDVARRAFHPGLPMAPDIVEYQLALRVEFSRVIFLNIISLLPGTLCIKLEGDRLTLHVLDNSVDPLKQVALIEKKVALMFITPNGLNAVAS